MSKLSKGLRKAAKGPLTLRNPSVALGLTGAAFGQPWAGGLTGGLIGRQFSKPTTAPPPPELNAGSEQQNLQTEIEKERNLLAGLGKSQYEQINQYGNQFSTDAATRRQALAKSLSDIGQQTFQQANPFILQDLNARGLATSPTEVNNQQAQALKEIALSNQGALNNFDTGVFNTQQGIKQDALSALLGGQAGAVGAATDLGRTGLERSYQLADQSNQDAMAKYLAKKQSRNNLINSLISAGGSIGGGALAGM